MQSYKAQLRSGFWETVRPKSINDRMQNLQAAMYQQRTELAEQSTTIAQQSIKLAEQSEGLSNMRLMMVEHMQLTKAMHAHFGVAASSGDSSSLRATCHACDAANAIVIM